MVNPPIFSGQCLTKHGAPCKFPFIFEGKTYNQCTDYKFGFFWCATEVDITLEMVDNQIGICKDSCPRGDILRGTLRAITGPAALHSGATLCFSMLKF